MPDVSGLIGLFPAFIGREARGSFGDLLTDSSLLASRLLLPRCQWGSPWPVRLRDYRNAQGLGLTSWLSERSCGLLGLDSTPEEGGRQIRPPAIRRPPASPGSPSTTSILIARLQACFSESAGGATSSPMQHAILMVLYGTGVRRIGRVPMLIGDPGGGRLLLAAPLLSKIPSPLVPA